MSETQIIKKLTPSIRVSSTDSHRMLTPPAAAAQVRAGTRSPRTGGQPLKSGASDVQFRTQPIDIVMSGGASHSVVQPPRTPGVIRRAAPRAVEAPGRAPTISSGAASLNAEQLDLCGRLVGAKLDDLERSEAPVAEIAIARGTLVALAKLAGHR